MTEVPLTPAPAPGDEAESGAPGTGETVCPGCNGTGLVGDRPCPTCEGSGRVVEGIGRG
jgi:RecJ-like exonuclease